MKTLSLSRRLLAAALVAAFAATPALASKDRDRHPAPPPQQHNNAHRPPAPPPQQQRHNNTHRPSAQPPAVHNAKDRRAAPPPSARRDVRESIRTVPVSAEPRFNARDRGVVRNYYQPRMKRGECPSGMHFERGRCYRNAPRPWVIGQPLPPTVVIEAPPPAVVQVLPPPPPQYRYASVAGDILLLAIGTNMVIDALDNLFD